jgi:hypothetical protein
VIDIPVCVRRVVVSCVVSFVWLSALGRGRSSILYYSAAQRGAVRWAFDRSWIDEEERPANERAIQSVALSSRGGGGGYDDTLVIGIVD